MPEQDARYTHRLELDGLIVREGDSFRTTRRFQSAMVRAARELVLSGEEREDLRVPIVLALLELYGIDTDRADLARLAEALLPIEQRELSGEPV